MTSKLSTTKYGPYGEMGRRTNRAAYALSRAPHDDFDPRHVPLTNKRAKQQMVELSIRQFREESFNESREAVVRHAFKSQPLKWSIGPRRGMAFLLWVFSDFTLEEIGKRIDFPVSRSRAQQIINDCRRRLRSPARFGYLYRELNMDNGNEAYQKRLQRLKAQQKVAEAHLKACLLAYLEARPGGPLGFDFTYKEIVQAARDWVELVKQERKRFLEGK